MDLSTATTVQLQQECKRLGLATWGTKVQLQNRLQEDAVLKIKMAAMEGANPVEKPVEKMIIPTETEVKQLATTHTGFSTKETQELLEDLKKRFASMMVIKFNSEDGVFTFEGGPQGRVTTTSQQPAMAIRAVAAQYATLMNSYTMNEGRVG